MIKRLYVVEMPLIGHDDEWFRLAECEHSEYVAALVRALLDSKEGRPCDIRVRTLLVEG